MLIWFFIVDEAVIVAKKLPKKENGVRCVVLFLPYECHNYRKY
jgi:hypothetical protein